MAKSRAVFLDRDGTIVRDSGFVHRVTDIEFLDGSVDALAALKRAGFLLIVVTNQSGVARGYYDEVVVDRFHEAMNAVLAPSGAAIDAFFSCPFHPDAAVDRYRGDSPLRKPRIGMYELATRCFAFDGAASFMVGDRLSDIEFARNAGLTGILVRTGHGASAESRLCDSRVHVADDLRAAAAYIIETTR